MVAVDPASVVHVEVPSNSPETPPRFQVPPAYVIFGLRSSRVVVSIGVRVLKSWIVFRGHV